MAEIHWPDIMVMNYFVVSRFLSCKITIYLWNISFYQLITFFSYLLLIDLFMLVHTKDGLTLARWGECSWWEFMPILVTLFLLFILHSMHMCTEERGTCTYECGSYGVHEVVSYIRELELEVVVSHPAILGTESVSSARSAAVNHGALAPAQNLFLHLKHILIQSVLSVHCKNPYILYLLSLGFSWCSL